MKIKVNSHFFKTEKKRDFYARMGNKKSFLGTYKDNIGVPQNINSRAFWDDKMESEKQILNKSPIYQDKLRIVTSYITKSKGCVLDIGVGYGDVEEILAKNKDLKLFGIDISQVSIKYLQDNYKGTFKLAGIFKIPFKSGFFDFALILDVLEHIPSIKIFEAYTEVKRVIKPGGLLIISVPVNEHLKELLIKGSNPNGHLREYTKDILKTEIEIMGFEIVEMKMLYAFNKNYYLKTALVRLLPFISKEPNLCIIIASKK
jgi:SAM-dependent methyltransferase